MNDILADRLAKYTVPDRLKAKPVTDADARRETSAGYRPKDGGSSSSALGKQSTKRKGNAQPSARAVTIGSIQVYVCGVDDEIRDTRCPKGQVTERLREQGLMVTKDPDGNPLQFDRNWLPIRVGQWLRDMLGQPGVFDYLDEKYGNSDVTPHYFLVGKEKQRIYVMKTRPGGGEDLDDAKGTGTNRNYKDLAVRVATRHKIPSCVYREGWEVAIHRLRAGEDMPSESEDEDVKPVRRTVGKSNPTQPHPRSVSEIEVGSSEDSDWDSDENHGIRELVNLKVKKEPRNDTEGVRVHRHSSRLSEVPGKKSLFDTDRDDDIEEISGFGDSGSRKRTASPSFNVGISDLEDAKRARSGSRESRENAIDVDTVSDDDEAGGRAHDLRQPIPLGLALRLHLTPIDVDLHFLNASDIGFRDGWKLRPGFVHDPGLWISSRWSCHVIWKVVDSQCAELHTNSAERVSSLASAFFRGADAAVLLYDVTRPETLDPFTKWWAEFRDKAPVAEGDTEFCVAVVGNKVDLLAGLAGADEEGVVTAAQGARFVRTLVPRPDTPTPTPGPSSQPRLSTIQTMELLQSLRILRRGLPFTPFVKALCKLRLSDEVKNEFQKIWEIEGLLFGPQLRLAG
ncbi:hypothetical protein DFH07DRAFT_961620 [Mycena maculata]|uniref:Uncharacterized protein n=1 Tax=Mycena maculata TaxID=230809 RepID=A0AAD7IVY5_9AGAR|nr:hypothetical protein DFH07DRAFT_961620 [Mycena maculata]